MPALALATFNIHHGEGVDGRTDLTRTADAIRATGASVVALQEIDVAMVRSGRVDQAAALAEATGLWIGFHPTLRAGDGGLYGLGLAAFREVALQTEELPRLHRDEEPRAVVVAQVEGLTVIATHLSLRADSRAVQLQAVTSLATAASGPVVVLGDLNQEPDPAGPLSAAGITGPRPPITFPRTRRRLDHILAGGGAKVEEVWIVTSDASDHVPLGGRVLF